jgi:membrane associated rhomboid family serine protease
MNYLIPFILIDLLFSIVLFLPLKDDRPFKSFPITTLILIGANTGIYIYMTYLLPRQIGDDGAWLFIRTQLLMVPALVSHGIGQPAFTMLSSAFMHASWDHLLGNMFFLWFFGRKVEDMLGSVKFALFYLVCVYVSNLGSVIGEIALPLEQGYIATLGASGAIMGVVGAYLFMYHGERIRTLPLLFGFIPIPFLPRVSASVFIFYTIIRDVLNGWLEQQMQTFGYHYSYINSFAHLSGVIAGLLGVLLFLPPDLLHYRYQPTLPRHGPESAPL